MPDIVLECRSVNHWFGAKKVLYDVNLRVARGEIVSLVGPSGCGKSTLFRAILGTHPPKGGLVLMNGEMVTRPTRHCGIVYQRYSLFPFLTAEHNVAFGPKVDQTNIPFRWFLPWKWWKLRAEHLKQASALLQEVGLAKSLHHYPGELSGGMCQRVAIAQALIMKPQVLLLDEPFGALDEATRQELQIMLLELYQENMRAKAAGRTPPYTMIIVTHELNEALYVADRVVALSQFWDWKGEKFPDFPGATLVYDATAPVFRPDEERKYDLFLEQKNELRRAAFEEDYPTKRGEFIRFWKEVEAGQGTGIMATSAATAYRRKETAVQL